MTVSTTPDSTKSLRTAFMLTDGRLRSGLSLDKP